MLENQQIARILLEGFVKKIYDFFVVYIVRPGNMLAVKISLSDYNNT